MPAITSRQNPLVRRFREIARGERDDRVLLDGAHLVAEALDAGLSIQETVVAASAAGDMEIERLVERLRRFPMPITTASASVMDALSPVRSSSSIVAIAERPAARAERLFRDTPMVIVAVGVQDPGNLGAIVRVAEASGATGVIVAGSSAHPFGWKALRGSMGSALRVPILIEPDSRAAIHTARRHGCRIVATVPHGHRSLFDVELNGPIAVLVGGEGSGLTPDQLNDSDEHVTIPMHAPVESLNVAVTAALIAYEAMRQRLEAISSTS